MYVTYIPFSNYKSRLRPLSLLLPVRDCPCAKFCNLSQVFPITKCTRLLTFFVCLLFIGVYFSCLVYVVSKDTFIWCMLLLLPFPEWRKYEYFRCSTGHSVRKSKSTRCCHDSLSLMFMNEQGIVFRPLRLSLVT